MAIFSLASLCLNVFICARACARASGGGGGDAETQRREKKGKECVSQIHHLLSFKCCETISEGKQTK